MKNGYFINKDTTLLTRSR